MLPREGFAQLPHEGVVLEALDGANFESVAGDRIGDAGARGRAGDQHRAGTADAVLAAEVRSREAQMVAQEIREVSPRLDVG